MPGDGEKVGNAPGGAPEGEKKAEGYSVWRDIGGDAKHAFTFDKGGKEAGKSLLKLSYGAVVYPYKYIRSKFTDEAADNLEKVEGDADTVEASPEKENRAESLIEAVKNSPAALPAKMKGLSDAVQISPEVMRGAEGNYVQLNEALGNSVAASLPALRESEAYKNATNVAVEFAKANGLDDPSAEELEALIAASVKTNLKVNFDAALREKDYEPEVLKDLDMKFSFSVDDKGKYTFEVSDEFKVAYEKLLNTHLAVDVAKMKKEDKIKDAKRGMIGMVMTGVVKQQAKLEVAGVTLSEELTVEQIRALNSPENKEKVKEKEEQIWTEIVEGDSFYSYIYSFICYVTNGESYPWAREPYESFRNDMVENGGRLGGLFEGMEKVAKPLVGGVAVDRRRGELEEKSAQDIMASCSAARENEDSGGIYSVEKNKDNAIAGIKLRDAFNFGNDIVAMEVELPDNAGQVKFDKDVKGVMTKGGELKYSSEAFLGRGKYLLTSAIPEGTVFPTGARIRLLNSNEKQAVMAEWKAEADKKKAKAAAKKEPVVDKAEKKDDDNKPADGDAGKEAAVEDQDEASA